MTKNYLLLPPRNCIAGKYPIKSELFDTNRKGLSLLSRTFVGNTEINKADIIRKINNIVKIM